MNCLVRKPCGCIIIKDTNICVEICDTDETVSYESVGIYLNRVFNGGKDSEVDDETFERIMTRLRSLVSDGLNFREIKRILGR